MIRLWGVKKYSNAKQWKYIAYRLRERDAQGRQTVVQIDGVSVPNAKVKKEIARYGFQTALESEHVKLSTFPSSQHFCCYHQFISSTSPVATERLS
jgi:hypothetical protein